MGSTNRQYLHANHQGSIIAASGNNASSFSINTYDEYGVPGAANSGRFGYTGQMYLKELGLYHYRARVYSPEIGRFLQTDPIGYEDQMNLYAYVHNDPINYIDPTGEAGILACAIPTGPMQACAAVAAKAGTAAATGAKWTAGILAGLWAGNKANELLNESSDSDSQQGSDSAESKHRNQDTPSTGEPNSTVEGRRRTREYGSDGKPVRDYDKPHQGQDEDHVHEWENGVREHPGRPYSPLQ